jgi:hypothetical protein
MNNENIIFYKGDTGIISFVVEDATNTPSVPFDLTNYILTLTVKKKKGDADADALIKKDVSVHDDAVNGQSHFDLSVVEIKTMDYDDYVYDIVMRKNDDSFIQTVIVGHFEIQERVKD